MLFDALMQDKPLLGADPVIWYSFGLTHDPRAEVSLSTRGLARMLCLSIHG